MNRLSRLLSAGVVVLVASGLSACMTAGPSGEKPSAPKPKYSAVEGAWVDANGLESTFTSGAFETKTTDTGQKLADGSYSVNGSNVDITVNSLVRHTTSQVACLLVSASQLNCTSSAGQKFTLTRRA